MKKLFLFLIVTLTISTSCSKESLTVNFDIQQREKFEIPPSTLLDAFTLLMPVSSNWEQQFQNHDTRKDQLKELKLKKLTLSVTSPSGKTLRFLKNIEIYIVADGLVKKKIAFKENISDDIGQILELDLVDVDLATYAKKDEFKLDIMTTKDEINTDHVSVQADMLFAAVGYLLK